MTGLDIYGGGRGGGGGGGGGGGEGGGGGGGGGGDVTCMLCGFWALSDKNLYLQFNSADRVDQAWS